MAPNKDVPTTTAPTRSPSLAPHPDYWMRGGDLHFLLGHIRYRVHSHFFIRESKYWKNLLAGPTSPGDEPLLLGSSSTNAIVLDEKTTDFDCLLWVFYNTKFGDYSQARLKNWITILRYATKWEFPEVKELAIRHIDNLEMEVVDRIVLYRENNLPEKYLFPLYMQIASREELLGLEESRALGYETLVLIHQARERLRSQPPTGMSNKLLSPIRTDLKSTDVIDIVAATFNISLASVSPQPGNPQVLKSPAPSLTRQVEEDKPIQVLLELGRTGNLQNLSNLERPDRVTYEEADVEWDLEVADSSDSAWDDAWDELDVPGSL